jgi:hypothetical protein
MNVADPCRKKRKTKYEGIVVRSGSCRRGERILRKSWNRFRVTQNGFKFCNLKTGLPDFSWFKIPKRGKINQMPKIYQIAVKGTKCLLSETFNNIPKFLFLVCKYTIWQQSESWAVSKLANQMAN